MTSVTPHARSRVALLRRLQQLAPQILFGTLSDTYRTCGRPGCQCQRGQKHGPHLYVSLRGPAGRTQGYYVPQALQAAMRAGVAAWQEVQAVLRALAAVNREQLWASRPPRPDAPSQRRNYDPSRPRSAKPPRSAPARRRQTLGRGTARDRRRPRRWEIVDLVDAALRRRR